MARIVDDHHTFKEGGAGGGSYIPFLVVLRGGWCDIVRKAKCFFAWLVLH